MKLENILLMSLRSPYLDDAKVYPPLGILYLKSAVEQELPDVNVDLMDDYDLEDPSFFEPYDAVGLSVMTPQREESLRVLEAVKKNYSEKVVIVGGPHALHYRDEVVEQPWDYVITNDGQRSLIKILTGVAQRIESDKMGKIDWAAQPRPDRSSEKAVEFLSSYNYELQGRKAGTMLTATGCPERCTFCEDAMTAVRWRDTDTLAQEMDDLLNLGYSGVYLFDDLFAIAMPKIKPILAELSQRDLIFRCNGQARYFTKWGDEFAKLLAEHGCKEIAFGHETGSQTILDNINKRTTVQQNYQSIEFAREYGMNVKSFILLGLPGETRETIEQTEEFLDTTRPDSVQIALYYPYKGTQIRDSIDNPGSNPGSKLIDLQFQGEGLGAYGAHGTTEAVTRTKALSREELLTEAERMMAKYTTHRKWGEDKFFETHLAIPGGEYE